MREIVGRGSLSQFLAINNNMVRASDNFLMKKSIGSSIGISVGQSNTFLALKVLVIRIVVKYWLQVMNAK